MSRKTLLAWFIFLASFGSLIATDYVLRIADGDIRSGGLSEGATALIMAPVALAAVLLLIAASRNLRSAWTRTAAVGLHVALAFFITQVVAFIYVIGLRIDSF